MCKDLQQEFHCKNIEGDIMKNTKSRLLHLCYILSLIVIFAGCNNFDEPDVINNTNQTYPENPQITGIIPSDSAIAGVREIQILGHNFAVNGSDTNWVFIGGEPALIKSVTADKIIVHRPSASGDDMTIAVVIPSALGTAQLNNYKIEEPISEFGDFSRENYDLMAIEVDQNENLYIASRRRILHLTSDGVYLTQLLSLGSKFAGITDIKLGPGGLLYVLTGDKELYTLNLESGADEIYSKFSQDAERFDFDVNNNIYGGYKRGLFVIKSDKTESSTGYYSGVNILEVRVVGNYVYVLTADKLSRNPILDSDGAVGETEVVVNLDSQSDLQNCEFKSVNFSASGDVLFAIRGHNRYSLFILEEGSLNPFYAIDIIPQTVDQIIWGSGRYLYLNRGITLERDSVRLYRMGMESLGSPYNGRQ